MPAVMGGHIDFGFSTMAGIANQLRAGAIRVLILSQDKRIPAFPEIPPLSEKGYKGYFITHWTGLLAPAGIPQPVLQTLDHDTSRLSILAERISAVKTVLLLS